MCAHYASSKAFRNWQRTYTIILLRKALGDSLVLEICKIWELQLPTKQICFFDSKVSKIGYDIYNVDAPLFEAGSLTHQYHNYKYHESWLLLLQTSSPLGYH